MKCGVYKITGPNGRCYIGQSAHIPRRWQEHKNKLRRNRHENGRIQNAWNKYGESAFAFSVLIFCDVGMLDFYEQSAMYLFDAFETGYNLAPHAESNRGFVNAAVAERNRRTKGKDHPSFGKPRPDLALRNKLGSPMKGKKRPDLSARPRLRGPAHYNYGRKHNRPPTGPKKLMPFAEEITRLLEAGKRISAIARTFNVKWETVKFFKLWHLSGNKGTYREIR